MATARVKGDTRTVATAITSTAGCGGETAVTRSGRGSLARTPTRSRRSPASREMEAVLPVQADCGTAEGREGQSRWCCYLRAALIRGNLGEVQRLS